MYVHVVYVWIRTNKPDTEMYVNNVICFHNAIHIVIGSVKGFDSAYPSSVSQAKAMMLHNMAVVFCLRRENDKARSALQQVLSIVRMLGIDTQNDNVYV